MAQTRNHPQVKPLLSDEHFSVHGTLIEAWASQKSCRPSPQHPSIAESISPREGYTL
jgi:hypothetical protein